MSKETKVSREDLIEAGLVEIECGNGDNVYILSSGIKYIMKYNDNSFYIEYMISNDNLEHINDINSSFEDIIKQMADISRHHSSSKGFMKSESVTSNKKNVKKIGW